MRAAFAALVLTCTASLLAQEPWEPDRFPIACWRGPPRSHNDLAHYETLRNCNFTVVGPTGEHTAESNRRILDLCAQVGLKAILVDGRIGHEMVLGDGWKGA